LRAWYICITLSPTRINNHQVVSVLFCISGWYHKKFSTSCFEEISWHRRWLGNQGT